MAQQTAAATEAATLHSSPCSRSNTSFLVVAMLVIGRMITTIGRFDDVWHVFLAAGTE
jgi:hypothetical protein